MGGFKFRLGTYNVPSGSSAISLTNEARSAEFTTALFSSIRKVNGEHLVRFKHGINNTHRKTHTDYPQTCTFESRLVKVL